MAIIENGIVPANKVADDGDYEEHELKEACDVLARAEEIKANSKLMKAVQPLLEKKAKAYMSLSDLRDLAGKKKLEETGYTKG
jgi:hypothetical protein